MPEYSLLSNRSGGSNMAENLIKKLGGSVHYTIYRGNRDRSPLHDMPYPILYIRNSADRRIVQTISGMEAVMKLTNIIQTRRYLLSWLIIESKVGLYLALLINTNL